MNADFHFFQNQQQERKFECSLIRALRTPNDSMRRRRST